MRWNLNYALYALLIIPVGICTRKYANHLPLFIASYGGDVLWAMMVYLLCRAFITSINRALTTAILFSFSIELSQLYHAAWVDAIRQTRLGGLVLGFGFLWSDLICYTVGIGIVYATDRFLLAKTK